MIETDASEALFRYSQDYSALVISFAKRCRNVRGKDCRTSAIILTLRRTPRLPRARGHGEEGPGTSSLRMSCVQYTATAGAGERAGQVPEDRKK